MVKETDCQFGSYTPGLPFSNAGGAVGEYVGEWFEWLLDPARRIKYKKYISQFPFL
jgi:hypothetical protein